MFEVTLVMVGLVVVVKISQLLFLGEEQPQEQVVEVALILVVLLVLS